MRVPHSTVANTDWNIHRRDDGLYDHDQVQRAILLDIRNQLIELNQVFKCHRFLGIPNTLNDIRDNTKKRKRRKK